MTPFSQILLFISSFSPLFGIFALLGSLGPGWPTRVCALISILGFFVPFLILSIISRIAPLPFNVQTSQVRDGDNLSYIATYLIPFASMQVSTYREKIALGLFLIVIAIIYIRSELYYINPILSIFGFRIFQVTTIEGNSVVLVSRRNFLAPNTSLDARRLGNYIRWE